MANPAFGTLISESGSGFTWAGNSQQNRLTAWGNDPLCDAPSEAVYIRDEESGGFWSPTPLPIRELDAYRARHGAGYTVFEHNSHAIEQEMTVFVPQDDAGGDPLCLKRLRLRNDGSRYRRLAVTFYAEWTLGSTARTPRCTYSPNGISGRRRSSPTTTTISRPPIACPLPPSARLRTRFLRTARNF